MSVLLGGCDSGTATTAKSSSSSSPLPSTSASSPAAPVVSDAALFADLGKAIRSSDPSLSPDALNAHIVTLTRAPICMIVAPYDPSAESESAAFARTLLSTSGTDASLTTDLEGIVHDSKGKAFHTVKVVSSLGKALFLCGRPLRVGDLHGYALVAAPAQ